MTRPYSESFKRKMVQRLTMPGAPSAHALAFEVGVAKTTLSRWVRQAATIEDVKKKKKSEKRKKTSRARPPSAPEAASRPDERSLADKHRLLLEARGKGETELGAFLRREGLHEADLVQWQTQIEAALSPSQSRPSRQQARRLRKLERELRRKDKALAETAALLVLQKKVQEIWGDEDDDMELRNGS